MFRFPREGRLLRMHAALFCTWWLCKVPRSFLKALPDSPSESRIFGRGRGSRFVSPFSEALDTFLLQRITRDKPGPIHVGHIYDCLTSLHVKRHPRPSVPRPPVGQTPAPRAAAGDSAPQPSRACPGLLPPSPLTNGGPRGGSLGLLAEMSQLDSAFLLVSIGNPTFSLDGFKSPNHQAKPPIAGHLTNRRGDTERTHVVPEQTKTLPPILLQNRGVELLCLKTGN